MLAYSTGCKVFWNAFVVAMDSAVWRAYNAFIYLFIYFSTDIDNTSNTNKNNKMPAKDRKIIIKLLRLGLLFIAITYGKVSL